MSVSIGFKIFPTAESAKIRQNPHLIHYEARLPQFGDRFKHVPVASTPSPRQDVGDTVGRYDNWVKEKKQSDRVTTTQPPPESFAPHSMVSPDYEAVMTDFDRHLNDSVASSRSSEAGQDSYDLRHSEEVRHVSELIHSEQAHHSVEPHHSEPISFHTPEPVEPSHYEVVDRVETHRTAEASHIYDSAAREFQHESFPPPPPTVDYENLEPQDSHVYRESQADWPPMSDPKEEQTHKEVADWAATKNPYVFSTQDFSIDTKPAGAHHQQPEVVTFDSHTVVIPRQEETQHSRHELREEQVERVSRSSSEKSDMGPQITPHPSLIAELENSFRQVGTSPAAVKEVIKVGEAQRDEELRQKIDEVYRSYTAERFMSEVPSEENGIPVPSYKREMLAKKLAVERAEAEEKRLTQEHNSGKWN